MKISKIPSEVSEILVNDLEQRNQKVSENKLNFDETSASTSVSTQISAKEDEEELENEIVSDTTQQFVTEYDDNNLNSSTLESEIPDSVYEGIALLLAQHAIIDAKNQVEFEKFMDNESQTISSKTETEVEPSIKSDSNNQINDNFENEIENLVKSPFEDHQVTELDNNETTIRPSSSVTNITAQQIFDNFTSDLEILEVSQKITHDALVEALNQYELEVLEDYRASANQILAEIMVPVLPEICEELEEIESNQNVEENGKEEDDDDQKTLKTSSTSSLSDDDASIIAFNLISKVLESALEEQQKSIEICSIIHSIESSKSSRKSSRKTSSASESSQNSYCSKRAQSIKSSSSSSASKNSINTVDVADHLVSQAIDNGQIDYLAGNLVNNACEFAQFTLSLLADNNNNLSTPSLTETNSSSSKLSNLYSSSTTIGSIIESYKSSTSIPSQTEYQVNGDINQTAVELLDQIINQAQKELQSEQKGDDVSQYTIEYPNSTLQSIDTRKSQTEEISIAPTEKENSVLKKFTQNMPPPEEFANSISGSQVSLKPSISRSTLMTITSQQSQDTLTNELLVLNQPENLVAKIDSPENLISNRPESCSLSPEKKVLSLSSVFEEITDSVTESMSNTDNFLQQKEKQFIQAPPKDYLDTEEIDKYEKLGNGPISESVFIKEFYNNDDDDDDKKNLTEDDASQIDQNFINNEVSGTGTDAVISQNSTINSQMASILTLHHFESNQHPSQVSLGISTTDFFPSQLSLQASQYLISGQSMSSIHQRIAHFHEQEINEFQKEKEALSIHHHQNFDLKSIGSKSKSIGNNSSSSIIENEADDEMEIESEITHSENFEVSLENYADQIAQYAIQEGYYSELSSIIVDGTLKSSLKEKDNYLTDVDSEILMTLFVGFLWLVFKILLPFYDNNQIFEKF